MTTPRLLRKIESLTHWIGSISSLIVHSLVFATAFSLGLFHALAWDTILLVLTTVVSLEAIYLAIFIQMTVNNAAQSLRAVEQDVDEIQKDIDAIEHDVDEIQEDEAEEEERDAIHQRAIEDISDRLQILLDDVKSMKNAK
jgi:peptidoglycan hydrolase CwlO-like protein